MVSVLTIWCLESSPLVISHFKETYLMADNNNTTPHLQKKLH
jgi:hypothetical protein